MSATSRYSGKSDAAISGLETDVPGDDPRCDAGGCQRVILTERQALVMPAFRVSGSGCQFHSSWTPADGFQKFST